MIIEHAAAYPAKAIVVTGGEPLLYNLDYLCQGLRRLGIATFLETSGSSGLSGKWDWICLSPKKDAPPLPEIFAIANELKVIIEDKSDLDWAEKNAVHVSSSCIIYLQPEWSQRDFIIPVIVKYIQENPKWKISLQAHKYMRIP
jgi:organic radical activating enzyme